MLLSDAGAPESDAAPHELVSKRCRRMYAKSVYSRWYGRQRERRMCKCMCVCKMRISSCRRRREFDFDLLDHRTKRPTVDLSPVAKDGAKSEVKVFVDDDDDDADSGVLSSIQTFHTAHTKEDSSEFSVPPGYLCSSTYDPHTTRTNLEGIYM